MITPAHRTPIRSILFAVFPPPSPCLLLSSVVLCVISLRKMLAFVFVGGVDFACGYPAAPEPWLSFLSRNV